MPSGSIQTVHNPAKISVPSKNYAAACCMTPKVPKCTNTALGSIQSFRKKLTRYLIRLIFPDTLFYETSKF